MVVKSLVRNRKNKRNHAKEWNTQGRSTQAIPLLLIGGNTHQWTSEINLNPSSGTLGITNSPAVQASGHSTFVVPSERLCRWCILLDPVIPSSEMEAIDATFHVCLLACSLVKSSRLMKPILVTHVLMNVFSAAEEGRQRRGLRYHGDVGDGSTEVAWGTVDEITGQWECVLWPRGNLQPMVPVT